MHTTTTHRRISGGGLYAITDGPRRDLMDACKRALQGGAAMLQYRDKTNDHARRRAEARELVALCADYGVALIINDDVDLAVAINAPGVHLGEHDSDITSARARLGADGIIGVSCYDSIELANRAARDSASYLAFGSFFDSPTKPHARRATPDLLRAAKPLCLPLVAIGGITPENAPALIEAGADFLAVISGVFGQADVCAAAQAYKKLFDADRQG